MIDPITANHSERWFKGLQMMVAKGREIEDCVGQLPKWAGAASDIAFLEKKAKNPPGINRLLIQKLKRLKYMLHKRS